MDFLYYVAPDIIGAVTGVLLGGLLVQQYWTKKADEAARVDKARAEEADRAEKAKANEAVLIDYITGELDQLVDITLEYWSIDLSGAGNKSALRAQAQKLSAKIKGTQKNLTKVLEEYSKRYNRNLDVSSLMGEIIDACTNGEFDGANRAADHHRFSTVVNAAHRLRWGLLERRIS